MHGALFASVAAAVDYNDHGLGIDGSTLVPSRLKDLFAQTPVVQLGQCANPTGSLVLRGVRAGGDAFALPAQVEVRIGRSSIGLFALGTRGRLH